MCVLRMSKIDKRNRMAPEKRVFRISGPVHLTAVDWEDPDHRRSVAASLVHGAYILEYDRQKNREGEAALASPWWEFFHFQLIQKLVDDADSSIFGAIYESKSTTTPPPPPHHHRRRRRPTAPKYVIAFRGNILKRNSYSRDFKLNFHVFWNDLDRTSRFQIAIQAVRKVVSAAGNSNLWLAGHSLGSAVAMLAGKNMAQNGVFLESYLFNPPFVPASLERIKDTQPMKMLRFASTFITAGPAVAIKSRDERSSSDDLFAKLSAWVPYLFVHPGDHICSEYVGYFEQMKNMEEIGAGATTERLATRNTVRNLFLSTMGREFDPLHLLPSANLTINQSPSPHFKRAHGIHQWWRTDLNLKCMSCHF